MKAKLFYQEGTSDKVYNVAVVSVGGDQYSVNFTYGKRGSVLKEGTKTIVPVPLSQAMKIFDALVAEKTKKGYKPVMGVIPEKEKWFRVLSAEEVETYMLYEETEDMKEEKFIPIETTIRQLADHHVGTVCGTVGNSCFGHVADAGFGERRIRCYYHVKDNCVMGMPSIECSEEESERIEESASRGDGSLRADSALKEFPEFCLFEIE